MALSPPGPVICLPSARISPPSGFNRPNSTLRKVLLPHPEGPTRLTNSPFATSSVSSLRAVTESLFLGLKVRLISLAWMHGIIRIRSAHFFAALVYTSHIRLQEKIFLPDPA